MSLFTGTNEHDGREVKLKKPEPYTSKSIIGECKNSDCTNKRRSGSAYCQKCSDRRNRSL